MGDGKEGGSCSKFCSKVMASGRRRSPQLCRDTYVRQRKGQLAGVKVLCKSGESVHGLLNISRRLKRGSPDRNGLALPCLPDDLSEMQIYIPIAEPAILFGAPIALLLLLVVAAACCCCCGDPCAVVFFFFIMIVSIGGRGGGSSGTGMSLQGELFLRVLVEFWLEGNTVLRPGVLKEVRGMKRSLPRRHCSFGQGSSCENRPSC